MYRAPQGACAIPSTRRTRRECREPNRTERRYIRASARSRRESAPAASTRGARISSASKPRAAAGRAARGCRAAISRTAIAACTAGEKQALSAAAAAERRDRVRLQRPAVRAPAARALPGTDQGSRGASRRRGAVRGRRARDVRRRHAGPARHGAVAVQPRRDRARDGGRAVARPVRRRTVLGRVRQDRAGPTDRRAGVRPPAGDVRAGRTDDVGARQQGEGEGPRGLRGGQSRAHRAARGRVAARITAPGTCTFYGTANSNQLVLEFMGLQLPGTSFVEPRHAAARPR